MEPRIFSTSHVPWKPGSDEFCLLSHLFILFLFLHYLYCNSLHIYIYMCVCIYISYMHLLTFDVARQECKMQRINTEKASLQDRKPHRDTRTLDTQLNFVGNLHWPTQKKKCRKPETRTGYTSDTKLFVVVCTQIRGTDHGTAEQHSPIEFGGWTDG